MIYTPILQVLFRYYFDTFLDIVDILEANCETIVKANCETIVNLLRNSKFTES